MPVFFCRPVFLKSQCALGLFCWVVFVLGSPICSSAQELHIDGAEIEQKRTSDRWVPSFRTLGQDAVGIVEAPLELSASEQFLTLGASGLVLSTAAAFDRTAYRYTSVRAGTVADATNPLAAPGRWYDRVGPDRFALGTAGVLAAGGLVLQRRDWTRTSVRVVEALVYTKAVTGIAKSVINRSRPFVGSGPLTADPGAFSGAHDKLSMPSGHTARAFAVASVLAHRAGRWYVSVPAYGMAASVGLERVRSGDHWLTDVMVGGALGYLIGRSVAASPPTSGEISYTPILSTRRVGLSIRF
jgi:membrane-associated phospholipid phosphatase